MTVHGKQQYVLSTISQCEVAWSACRATWTEQETLCMKRHALICCLQEAKHLHSKQWARTSVEMAFEVDCFSHLPGVLCWFLACKLKECLSVIYKSILMNC